MSETANRTRFIAIGSMLFALFFGAGNLIFPRPWVRPPVKTSGGPFSVSA